MKPKKILLLAIFSGLLTTGVFYIFMQQNTAAEVEEPIMVQVISAAADIGENVQLTDENLQMAEMRESEVHPAAIKDKDEAVGEYASTELVAGEVLLGHHIEQRGEADILSKKVAYGYRAVSFGLDYVQSVSNMVQPNDRVDIVHLPNDETDENGYAPAEILFENVKVLAVNQRMKETAEGEAIGEYTAVTVEMKQADAVKVADANYRGPLHLLLISRLKENGEVMDVAVESVDGMTNTAEASEIEGEASELSVEETADTTDKTTSPDIIVLPERAHVRNGPSLDANVLTVVDAGDELVTKNEEAADADGRIWLHVETKSGIQGWISSRIIKMGNE
ncbi:Flp pilus assembly protein CpaB [Salinicoccus hispanicus]|uniref:Flp pilus assembly protein CpaB n=1 Tax=Salinicoccus hispanicus TaxID=157225 RepID=A0A6N8U2P2_9STAP|nr:Flp pilus assembly protein CpaB [Salinicoccus hispanicus]MXQ51256.1 Flp pilus assembly protein CpaB [Salinicoccus hispanicus]